MEGVGEGSNLGSVWSTCPMQWLADLQGQEGLSGLQKDKGMYGVKKREVLGPSVSRGWAQVGEWRWRLPGAVRSDCGLPEWP